MEKKSSSLSLLSKVRWGGDFFLNRSGLEGELSSLGYIESSHLKIKVRQN